MIAPRRLWPVAVLALLIAACAGTTRPPGESARALLSQLPATFTGEVGCRDCPPSSLTLLVRPEGTYILRTRHDRSVAVPAVALDELGRWSLATDSTALLLRARPDLEVRLDIRDAETLVIEPSDSISASADGGRKLRRVRGDPWMTPRLQLRGLYERDAKGARFRDCPSGLLVAVSREGAAGALDAALGDGRSGVMVDIIGRIERRPRMEVAMADDVLVVEQFNGRIPGDSCLESGGVMREIAGTSWRLVSVRGAALTTSELDADAHLTIERGGSRATGRGGCNGFGAAVVLDGAGIRFSQIVSTKMACDNLDLEGRFFAALEEARAWRISDGQLELLDDAGSTLAVFIRRG